MTTAKYLGIWMDHSTAHIMEFNPDEMDTTMLPSTFTQDEDTYKGENNMHNKEQHQEAEYFKKLGEKILHYDSVLLFGPTEAKNQLHNILKEDHHFDKIKITVKSSDKMTDHQKHAFVNDFFSMKGGLTPLEVE